MKTTIYLIRHAQTECNASGRFQGWSDIELNSLGFSQAKLVADRLSRIPIDAVYTSPLKRTSITAGIIAERHGITPVVLPGLMEINYGEWEGKSRTEVAQKWPEILTKMRSDPTGVVVPNGESFAEFSSRSIKAFQDICRFQEGKRIIIVSHSGVIKAILMTLFGAGNAIWGKLEVENVSVSTVEIVDGLTQIVSINDTSHLVLNEIIRFESPTFEIAKS